MKDTKSKQGSFIGFSRIQETTLEGCLTVHERNGILKHVNAICVLSETKDNGHRDLKNAKSNKDESEIHDKWCQFWMECLEISAHIQ